MASEQIEFTLKLKDLMSKGLSDIDSKLNKVDGSIKEIGSTAKKQQTSMSSIFKGTFLSGLALQGVNMALSGIKSLAGGVFTITGEFEKYNAVLTNTFQSQEMASLSMGMIKDMAAKTPFSVNELTGAFVKLANRGMAPTSKEMTAFGDIASSTGKSFDQLAEAVLDATTGEFERLKEFGIKGSVIKGTNKVALNFKGVRYEVEKNEQAITDLLVKFGQMDGVKGSMAAISATLEGTVSNLGDNFDTLKLKIGEMFRGGMGSGLAFLNKLIEKATYFIDWIKVNFLALKEVFSPLFDAIQPIVNLFKQIAIDLGFANSEGNILAGIFNTIGTIIKYIAPLIKVVSTLVSNLISGLIEGFKFLFNKILLPIGDFINKLLPEKYQIKMSNFGFKEPKKEETNALAEYDKAINEQRKKVGLKTGGTSDATKGSKTLSNEVAKVQSRQPSNVYINIDAIIKGDVNNMINNSNNPQQDLNNFLVQIENALLSVINDVNLVTK